MKVILTADVKGTGKKGDLVEVADGYAKNFLIKRKLANPADAQGLSEFKNKEAAKKHQLETEIADANAVADKLKDQTIKLTAKAGQGKLFGSITAKEVADATNKEFGVDLDRRKLSMDDIKNFGTFTVIAKLGHGIETKFYVLVSEE